MRTNDWKAILRMIGIMLVAEGTLMALCLIPSLHFADGTERVVAICSALTLTVGLLLWVSFAGFRRIEDRRMAYLLVTLLWVTLTLFAALPLMATGATSQAVTGYRSRTFTYAMFESMSGLTTTGATIFPEVGTLPASILLWRSMMQWFGGFGIVLLVLALVPRLGINKYALYTAEASTADNTGRRAEKTSVTVRRMFGTYLVLTVLFIVALRVSGLQLWDSVCLTFTNISSGGFSVNSDGIARLTSLQQYILSAAMLVSGVNFMLIYLFFTFRWRQIGHKLEQFRCYIVLAVLAVVGVAAVLHLYCGMPLDEAVRLSTVQSISSLTTTGTVTADTSLWPVPVCFFLLMLSLCGGMAGSTSGGMKVMRVLILMRNARAILHDRLHPDAINPVRLNGRPVSDHIRANVMVIFLVYGITLMVGTMLLMLFGTSATEAIGATVGCLTGYGPGLGASGGFGCYAAFSTPALWLWTFLMLLGRLECMTVLVVLLPRFWRK